MSWFTLNEPVGSSYAIDQGDLINTKLALNRLGYYEIPEGRGIDDWTDDAMFKGIRTFQRDNSLKIDGLMNPGGPTEDAINRALSEKKNPSGDIATRVPILRCSVCGAPHGGAYGSVCKDCYGKGLG